MASRVLPDQSNDIIISFEANRSIPYENKLPEEEMEKKAIQTIYAQLKQIACSQKPKERWKNFENIFKNFKYKNDKKKIIEKLDDNNNYAPIHYAVLSNNQFICQQLLSDKYKCNVNLLGQDGQTPLHLAASSSKIEEEIKKSNKNSILTILLNHKKIRVNIRDDKGRTPLHHAIMRNHCTIIKILLDHKANPEIPDIQGATSIHYAYRFGENEDIYSLFPLHVKFFQMKTIDNKNPLDIAAEYNHLNILEKYFQNSSFQLSPNSSIYAFIQSAIRHNNSEFLSKRFSMKDKKIQSYIIQLACRYPNGYKLLIDHQTLKISNLFNKNLLSEQISEDGFTPLMIAVKYQQEKCVELLLDIIDSRDNTILTKSSLDFERTVLHICAEYPNESITKNLLDKIESHKIDLSPIDVMGDTPLHICAEKNNLFMCNKLLSIYDKSLQLTSTIRSNSNNSMLNIRNNNGLTVFHVATENGHYEMVKQMIEVVKDSKLLIEQYDQQLRTSLHIAASKGNAEIIRLFLECNPNVDIRDINDHTPLHEAVHWSDSNDKDNQYRIECINCLIKADAEINALNIHRESPLHIACRYSSSDLVETLLDHGANLLQTNFQGYNCLEVAIEEKNEKIVKYLINQDYIFELMRNAQIYEKHLQPCCTCGSQTCRKCCCIPCCKCLEKCSFYSCRLGLDHRTADTPMRKLIINMPDMAYEILEKCTTTIGSEKSKIHKIFFDYEFLEDQYVIYKWSKGNINNDIHMFDKSSINDQINKDEPYSYDFKTLVMGHPLFLMAVHNQYKLMAHPLSKSLVDQKFFGFSLFIFFLISFVYATFLGIYTTIILRTTHPQYYYNSTDFEFGLYFCKDVIGTLGNNALKGNFDKILRILMYITMLLVLIKDIWYIIAYARISWSKIFTFILELITIGCGFYFIYDHDYQTKYTMRCPLQWDIGAYGLFSGYMSLFYYIQYIPIFGIYVIMMRQILIRFLLFLPVLMVLICGFSLVLYMTFPNFKAFDNMGISIAKTAIMSTGEINYDDLMHNDETTAYYKVGYILLVFFAVTMPVLATNLLIGLAVGEVGPMMTTAKNVRLDMFYELAADLEILKLQFLLYFNCCCKCFFIRPRHYREADLTQQWRWFKNLKKQLLESCAREVVDDDNNDLSNGSEDEENHHNSSHILQEIRSTIQQINKPLPVTTFSQKNVPRRTPIVTKLQINPNAKKK